MNPALEFFLEEAFERVQPTSPAIGRVVVEPDYDVTPDDHDRNALANELRQAIGAQSPEPAQLASAAGYAVAISQEFPLVAKYLRSVTLHADALEGPWVEVAPPGNWI